MSARDNRPDSKAEPGIAIDPAVAPKGALQRGIMLSAISRAYAQLTQIVIFVFAARVLGPAEFGVFALVSAFAFIALKISEAGWAEYIMSWSGGIDTVRRTFGMSVLSGAAMMVVCLIAAALVPLVTDEPDKPLLMVGFALWVLLATPSAVLNGTMIWQGRIISFALCGMFAETFGLLVSLAMLYAGYGVLALVGGRLALQIVFLVVALAVTGLTPAFRIARDEFRELVGFSFNILASRLVVTLRAYAAVFIVGGFLGPAAVGYFRAGQRVVGAFSELIGEPTRILAWRTFRAARDNGRPGVFQECANSFFPVLGLIAIPSYLWITLFAEQIVVGLLGAEWAPAAPVIMLLSLAALLGVMGYATEPLMSLTGNTRLMLRLFFVYAVIGVGFTLVSAPFGLIALTLAQLAVAVIILAVNLHVYRTRLAIAWTPIVRNLLPSVVPVVLSSAALLFLNELDVLEQVNPLVRAILLSLPVLVLYLGLLVAFYRRGLLTLWSQAFGGPSVMP